RRGAFGMRCREAPWDDCGHREALPGKLWLGGSYSTTGITAKPSTRRGPSLEIGVNGHSPTQRLRRGACWRVASNWYQRCSVAGHHGTTAAGAYPPRPPPEKAVTVGGNCRRRATN